MQHKILKSCYDAIEQRLADEAELLNETDLLGDTWKVN